MEQLGSFFTENKFLSLIVVVILLFFVVKIVKSLVKMAVVVAIIALIMVVFFDFKPQEVVDKGTYLAKTGTGLIEESFKPVFLNTFNYFIKRENGDTIIKIDSLDMKYNLTELIEQINPNEQSEDT
ncbi:hypothetical protein [Aquibacillus saliphilus]|uniref:hypothetical protein n=1 Tax=Aquibacillus saliphilus TaxID=1909422 RepID=UPI001CF09505|nr:hypothetical protein [Aquibacillus saliphilus]